MVLTGERVSVFSHRGHPDLWLLRWVFWGLFFGEEASQIEVLIEHLELQLKRK